MRILLAEDNLLNQFVAKQILEEWEIVLEIANTGVEVLEKMAKQDFDLILMDLQMPEMDGFEATEYIRTKLSAPENSIPIIALTADAFQDTRQKALEIGMNSSSTASKTSTISTTPLSQSNMILLLMVLIFDIVADQDRHSLMENKQTNKQTNNGMSTVYKISLVLVNDHFLGGLEPFVCIQTIK